MWEPTQVQVRQGGQRRAGGRAGGRHVAADCNCGLLRDFALCARLPVAELAEKLGCREGGRCRHVAVAPSGQAPAAVHHNSKRSTCGTGLDCATRSQRGAAAAAA